MFWSKLVGRLQFCNIFFKVWGTIRKMAIGAFQQAINDYIYIKIRFKSILNDFQKSCGYGSVYGPHECCNNVYMVELFYVDMSKYNTSWRHEIRKHDHLNYCDQHWRSIRRQEISKHDHFNYCDKTWRWFRRLAITHLVVKTYCDKMLSEGFVIIIYVNKYAMTTCNKASCQTWWKK